MRRRPAGRAEARRRRRLRGRPPPGERRLEGGPGPGAAGRTLRRLERGGGGGSGCGPGSREWRGGKGRRRRLPAEPGGASPPASRRRPRRARPLCPQARGSQIGRETARAGRERAAALPQLLGRLGARPGRRWAGWSLSGDGGRSSVACCGVRRLLSLRRRFLPEVRFERCAAGEGLAGGPDSSPLVGRLFFT